MNSITQNHQDEELLSKKMQVFFRRYQVSRMSLHEEITQLRARLKAQDKEIRRLKKENDFLEEAIAFFAASRPVKSAYSSSVMRVFTT